jgi:hypothetical protein
MRDAKGTSESVSSETKILLADAQARLEFPDGRSRQRKRDVDAPASAATALVADAQARLEFLVGPCPLESKTLLSPECAEKSHSPAHRVGLLGVDLSWSADDQGDHPPVCP